MLTFRSYEFFNLGRLLRSSNLIAKLIKLFNILLCELWVFKDFWSETFFFEVIFRHVIKLWYTHCVLDDIHEDIGNRWRYQVGWIEGKLPICVPKNNLVLFYIISTPLCRCRVKTKNVSVSKIAVFTIILLLIYCKS